MSFDENFNKLRRGLVAKILPEISYELGFREHLGASISPDYHYTFALHLGDERIDDLSCMSVDTYGEPVSYGILFRGDVPKVGEKVMLQIFKPGLATYENYGVYNLPVREVSKNNDIFEVGIHLEDLELSKVNLDG